jgi:hypothetical protein
MERFSEMRRAPNRFSESLLQRVKEADLSGEAAGE